ncbi:DegV family protein [Paenibacillus kribbensis]|uniref:DegV family protein n=1 Tax=Paenibacillus TaxID=44249 RepID=UPI00024F03AA|nr:MULTISPECIES: DegV family protein [Paenibacillus]EHS58710.1 degv family protein [Paenibacillus sp. Aloe-11]MEC0234014.1 DegV family protein [Paenibacillus kribbensis]
MRYKIIADSCCDLTTELKEQLQITTIPLNMTLGEKCFIDDDTLDLPQFMEEMKACTTKIGSASPSPLLYKEAFQGTHTSFAITLSSNLSSSYASALIGKDMAEEENGADVHVFDSKSASAGQVLLALKLRKLIDEGYHKSEIISSLETFITKMKTYFVLENLDNLVKNGRMNKITGKILSFLHIRPILGSDGDGNIALFTQARGQNQIIEKLADTIEKSGRDTEGESIVITHCNNPGLAEKLMTALKNRYQFKDIHIVSTRGISSMYANDKGIIMAF